MPITFSLVLRSQCPRLGRPRSHVRTGTINKNGASEGRLCISSDIRMELGRIALDLRVQSHAHRSAASVPAELLVRSLAVHTRNRRFRCFNRQSVREIFPVVVVRSATKRIE